MQVADAWLICRSNGTREVVLSPLTDDTFLDDGDEAVPLFLAQDDAEIERLRAELRAKDERITAIIAGNREREACLRSYMR